MSRPGPLCASVVVLASILVIESTSPLPTRADPQPLLRPEQVVADPTGQDLPLVAAGQLTRTEVEPGTVIARDAFSRTVDNGDGTLTEVHTPRPQHWLDEASAWQTFANELRPVPEQTGEVAFETGAGPFVARFAPPERITAGEPLLRVADGEVAISVTPLGATPRRATLDGRTRTYRSAWPGADLRYTLDNELIKEEVVLGAAPVVPPALAFKFELDGLTAQRAPGGGMAFIDDAGTPRYAMPPLVMLDSAGPPALARVDYTLTDAAGGVLLTLTPSLAWLTDPARVYPVRIDPSVGFIVHRPKDDSNRNATVNQASPNTNYYGLPTLSVGKTASGQLSAALIRFGALGGLPADSVVTHAELVLRAASGTNGLGLEALRITSSWNDTTVTWNTAPTHDSTVVASASSVVGGETRFDVTPLVRGWIDDGIDNWGLRLRSSGSNGQTVSFHSSWATCTDCQPAVELTYVPANAFGHGMLRTHTRAEYGGGNSAEVEVSSGNLVFTHDGGRIDGRGFGVQLTHTYNSADPVGLASGGGVGVYGEGWSFAHNLRLFVVDGGRAVVLKDGTGNESRVFLAGSVSGDNRSYTAPIHFGFTLVEDVSSPPADKVWTLTSDAGAVKHFFDAEGKLTRIEDRNANYLTFAYDGSDRLTTITDLAGRTTTLEYNAGGGRLSKITDMASRVHTYAYNGAGDLTTIKHGVGSPDVVTTTLGYDDAHRLTSVTNPRGHTAEIRYTALNRWETAGSVEDWVASTADAAISHSTTRAHSGTGSLKATLTNVGSAADAVIEKDMNADPRALAAVAHELIVWVYRPTGTNALRARLTFEYVDNGETLSAWTDLAAGAWTAVVARPALVEARNQVRELEVKFRTQSGSFSGDVWVDDVALRGQVASQSDAKPTPNTVVAYAYDPDNRSSTVSRPDAGGTFRNTTYAWDRLGAVTGVTDPLGHTTGYERDELLRVFEITPPGSGAVPYQLGYYPNSMQLASVENGTNEVSRRGADLTTGDTTYAIDTRNEWRRSQSLGYDATRVGVDTATGNVLNVKHNQYAAGTNLDTNLNATPISTRRQMTYIYYTGGLLATMTDPLNRVTTFDYIRNRGYLTSIEAPAGHGESGPRMTTIDRNPDGSVNYLIDPDGKRTEFTYDGLGRLKTIRYGVVGGTPAFTVSYTLDPNGNLTSMTDQAGSTTWTYDQNNRVTAESRTQNGLTKTVNYAYHANGTLQAITTFGGQTVSFGYDAALRLTSQTDPNNGGGPIVFTYNDRGQRTRITYPSGVYQSIVFKGDHVEEVRLRQADDTYLQRFIYDYGFDTNGDVTSSYRFGFAVGVSELDGSQVDYGYDTSGRLDSAVRTGTNPFTQSYAYDLANNRTSVTDGSSTTSYTYDAANQLRTSTGGVSYSYDRNGNLLGYGGNSFTYDESNKWVSGTVGGTALSFTYDGLGRAASRTAAGSRTDYWFDQTGMTLESGANVATYLRDPSGLLLSGTQGSTFVNYGRDRLGSLTALVDTSQAITQANRYDPWGTTISSGSGFNRMRFTGALRDPASGFYVFGQRHYAPSLGRFTQLDPLPASVTDLNRHAYAACNPVNYVDPTGTSECTDAIWGAAALIIFGTEPLTIAAAFLIVGTLATGGIAATPLAAGTLLFIEVVEIGILLTAGWIIYQGCYA